MHRCLPARLLLPRALLLLALLAALLPVEPARSAEAASATLTVVRGTATVLRADGSSVASAPSGLDLGVGDEVATQPQSKALVTFFDGTQATIAVEAVVGSTVHRVSTLLDPGSTYRVVSGGSVALVRGTVFTHTTQANGDVNVSLQECGQRPGAPPTNACLEFPRPGRFMQVGENCTVAQRGNVTYLTCARPTVRTTRTVRRTTTTTTRTSR